jgi:hypothetical protein
MTAQVTEMPLFFAARLLVLNMGIVIMGAGCTEPPSLTIAEKTRFVAELIAERVECDGYRQKLSVPAKNAKMLDDVYEAAKAAYCLKPDV